jgi:hypothetical protein
VFTSPKSRFKGEEELRSIGSGVINLDACEFLELSKIFLQFFHDPPFDLAHSLSTDTIDIPDLLEGCGMICKKTLPEDSGLFFR